MTLAARLAEIRARVEAASPAPWTDDGSGYCIRNGRGDRSASTFKTAGRQRSNREYREDCAFIAAARTDVPLLLAVAAAAAEACGNVDNLERRNALRAALDALAKETT